MTLYLGNTPIAGGGTVDQTYDGTSTNAQSGTAVAGAIANKADKATTLSGYGITDGADTDLSNLTSTGKSYGSGLGMPSDTYDNLTLGASGSTYTAPANGCYRLNFLSSGTNGFIAMYARNTACATANPGRFGLTATCQVSKGESMQVFYGNGSLQSFYFYYAEGEV